MDETTSVATATCLSADAIDEERALCRQAAAGDNSAFMGLIMRYDAASRALAWHLLRDATEMDDALQDAYLKAFKGIRRFAGRSSFGTWLHSIVYRVCLDHLRGRRDETTLDDATRADCGPDPSERVDITGALDALPTDQLGAVILVDALGYDYREAGRILRIAPGTVGSRLSRAHAALRDRLGASYGDDR